MPFILLVAGPNAAGKSTLLRLAVLRPKAVFVNADDPARDLPESMGTGMRNFRAGRMAIERLAALLNAGADAHPGDDPGRPKLLVRHP